MDGIFAVFVLAVLFAKFCIYISKSCGLSLWSRFL